MTRTACLAGLVLALVGAANPFKPKVPPPPEKLDLPAPLAPAESLAAIKVRPGFKVELVAAEPLVMDPIDIAWGPDGRLWVVEMADYPLGLDGKGKPGGRVRFLEDTNGDGQYDHTSVFVDELPFPTGVMPWRNGVLITAAPALLYAEDTDADGKADVLGAVYTGFGEGNQQHRFNSPRWGLDNWVHLANGDSDGVIRSVRTGEQVNIRGRDLRVRPDDGLLDPQTGRAQFGRNRDGWGHWFGGNNSNPMWHYVLEDHYLRRNPHLAAAKSTVMVSEKPGAAPVFPVSRTLPRFNDLDKANRFTSACGTMVYRDELLGPALAGNAFICEPVHNLVHREVMKPRGVTFSSKRADDEQTSEFLASSDSWFRPTAVHTGPDGALWVVDMYRLVIEHPQWIPVEWQKRLDLRAGYDRGRIYRVFPEDRKPRPMPRLDRLDTAGLVAALDSPNGWQRDMAQQMLLWKSDEGAVQPLREMARKAQRPLARLHALCTLDGLKGLTVEDVRSAIADPHPGVRRHGLRLAEPLLPKNPELGESLLTLVKDLDPQVQMQLAYSLGAWRDPKSGRVLGELALRHAKDSFLPTAIFSSLHEVNVAEAVAVVLAPGPQAPPENVVEELLRMAAAMADDKVLTSVLATLGGTEGNKLAPWQLAGLSGILESAAHRPVLRKVLDGAGRETIQRALTQARGAVDAAEAPEAERLIAIRLLARATNEPGKEVERLATLLGPRSAPELQQAALAALAHLGHETVPPRILAEWNALSPPVRNQALGLLLSRAPWTGELLKALEDGTIPAGQLDATARQRLLEHKDTEIRHRAEKLLGAGSPDRQKVLKEFEAVLRQSGDIDRGRQVFRQRCATCHQLEGVGEVVGPDLTALANKSPEALLEAILDPNRAIEDRYLSYVAATTDGRIFTGLLASETSTSITLKSQDGREQVLLRSRLENFRSTSKSLMPEGFEKDMSVQDLADVIAYTQRPRPEPK